jgi:hypothetical protein
MSGPAGREALEELKREGLPPDHIAPSLAEAAEWIFEDAKARHAVAVNR